MTKKGGYDSGGTFSPDGSRIAFYGPDSTGNSELFLIEPDGSNLYNLTNDPMEDYSPAWSPDGSWIAYTSGSLGFYDIWIINVETRKKIRLTDKPKRNETPFWMPDSQSGK